VCLDNVRQRVFRETGNCCLTSRDHGLSGPRAGIKLQAMVLLVPEQEAQRAMPTKHQTYKVYLRCSSISMMAAWLPHL
jgi:hypothetical protein